MTFGSELWNIDGFLKQGNDYTIDSRAVDYTDYFNAGATAGEAASRLFFLCFRDLLTENYANSKLLVEKFKKKSVKQKQMD